MPIEFNCPQCHHRLRTPDDSAGRQSRCPQCGHIQTIPATGGLEAADWGLDPPPPAANPFAESSPTAASNPYSAPSAVTFNALEYRRSTVLPGSLMIGLAITNIVLLGLAITAGIVTVLDEGLDDDDVLAFVFLGFSLAVQFLILWGGINLVRCRGYAMAMAGTVAAIAPLSVCWCLHLPFGLWAFVVLLKPGMRSVFSEDASQVGAGPPDRG